jgi:hypothetical protein
MTIDGWVAEEPEAHLLPHLERAAATLGLQIRSTRSQNGIFELDLDGNDRSQAELRAAAMSLIASIAESSTHVRQLKEGEFEIVTGMLPGDSPVFATHGHQLRIRFV